MASTATPIKPELLRTLPSDAARQIQWRFADRYDLQMLVQSARAVARGPVARLVASGGRNSHDWTPAKAELLEAFDKSGITAVFMEPEQGGFIAGPKNLALALVAFELAWVDGGAATASLAGCLALAPIHERGTPEQQTKYMQLAAPPQPGEDRKPWRGAFCLTEPIPYVGVDTGMLNGKIRIAEWKEGEEPILQVEKRGRFITNIGFANFVTAAVDSGDERIKGSCMVILEEGDPGIFDRGTPTRKLVHQLSSTGDPIFNLRIPASRIVGGYDVKDGVIVPRYSHSEVIEAVFRRTRVTVGVMTAAKLLSAVEPVIRYQRGRFRGAETATPGSVRYEIGLQAREDALHRLVDVWATGEAGASLGFAAARAFDELDPLEREADSILASAGVTSARARSEVAARSFGTAADCSACRPGDPRKSATAIRSAPAFRASGFAGGRSLPRHQAVEHGLGRADDARSGQPDGRLRHHRRLPRLPRQQVDGRATGSHLRRTRSRAAAATLHHHDQPGIPARNSGRGSRRCAALPPNVPAPAHAHWQQPWECGCGRSSVCRVAPMPTAAVCTRARARV